jgi:hypothetical protein
MSSFARPRRRSPRMARTPNPRMARSRRKLSQSPVIVPQRSG